MGRLCYGLILILILTPRAQADCEIPWAIQRSDSESCAAKIQVRKSGQKVWLCLGRSDFGRWLELSAPGCWRWNPELPIRLTQAAALDLRPGAPQSWARVQGVEEAPRVVSAVWLLRGLQWVERQREAWSKSISAYDATGWLRGWVVGEKVRAPQSPLPAAALFSLGFVHLLTSAGVHLIFLSRWIRLICSLSVPHRWTGISLVLEGCVMLWVWCLSGMRWGMLRPLFLVLISRALRGIGIPIRAPLPLLGAVVLELALAADLQEGWHGRLHYLAAVWGGVWGAKQLEMSVGSWLWVVPLQAFYDRSLSLANPLLSMITIPVAGAVLLPLSLVGVVFPEVLPAVGWISEGLLRICLPIAGASWANWMLDPRWWMPALGAAALVYAWGRMGAWIAVLFAILFAWIVPASGPEPRVIQLDVGQGDSALVIGPQGVGLIDVGSARSVSGVQWLSLFSRWQIARLDWVVLTHLDEDHAGGLRGLFRWIPIGCLVLPPAHWDSDPGRRLREEAQSWGVWVQATSQGCFPYRWASLSASKRAPNSGMAGVRVPLSGGYEYLNLGDASHRGASPEGRLLAKLGRDSHRKLILKLSHHGSRTSSDASLLRALRPSEAWISAGFANRYRHPHPQVLETLRRLEIPWRGTWKEGGLSLILK